MAFIKTGMGETQTHDIFIVTTKDRGILTYRCKSNISIFGWP